MSARAAKRARPTTRVQRKKPYRRSILVVPPEGDYDVSAFFAEREKDVTYFPQLKPRKRASKARRVSPPLQHDPAEQIRIPGGVRGGGGLRAASTSTAREPSTSTAHEKSEVSALRTSITAASSSMHTAHSLHQTRPSTSPERTAVPELQQAVLSLSPSMAQFRSEVEKSRFLSTTRAPQTLNATTFGLSTLRDPNLSSLEKLLHVEFHANDLLKLGEGTHAEVFQAKTIAGEDVALKIVPFTVDEDDLVTMNGDTMKTCDAITSEAVISHQLSGLTDGIRNNTDGFVRVVRMSVVKGDYPAALLKAWKVFKKTRKEGGLQRLPGHLRLARTPLLGHRPHVGRSVPGDPTNENEAVSIMLQTMLALMVAEKEYEFEHRDLHVGNVLVEKTAPGDICSYCLDGREIAIHAHQCRVKIIDFTLSRLNTRDFGIVCLNLDSDEDLFTGDGEGVKGGDYQFDIYRKMREANGNDWSAFTPVTSVFWMHYLSKKVFSKLKGKKKGERGKELQRIFDNLLEHETLGDFYFKDAQFQSLLEAYYL
ncbi:Non-specific serine/threonine protein kinase [Aphelenchoides fujianensis]|nr:Non-specific serine/threonine protein kinase [Aphelenchoides fujianensis]